MFLHLRDIPDTDSAATSYIKAMVEFHCPYCGQAKVESSPDRFSGCRFCGFKSALIDKEDSKILIVDRDMPYLQKRCEELSEQMPETEIIVDRRVSQDPQDLQDRRQMGRHHSWSSAG